MKKPVEIMRRNALYSALSGLMLVALFLMTGCEAPSGGAPGARPGMAPGAPMPGVPGAGRQLSAKPGGAKASFRKPTVANGIGAGKGPNTNPTAQNPLRPATNMADKKTEGQKPGLTPKIPGALGEEAGVNPLGPTAKVEQAGNTVNLASEILVAGTNPFLNRLPKPIVTEPTDPNAGTTTENVPPPADPFENVSLLGIAYHSKVPMALISVSGGESQTQMVRKGDVVMLDGAQIKVINIGPESIEFEKSGTETTSSEKRTFNLPSIIGFGTSDETSSKTSESSGMDAEAPSKKPDQERPQVKLPRDPQSGKTEKLDLSNLKKMSGGKPSGQSSAGGKSADVVLKEP